MMRRRVILFVLALWVGGAGCAGTARRPGGASGFAPMAWNEPAAPPQRQVAAATEAPGASTQPASKSEGLTKYFPGLVRTPVEPTKVAAKYRPSWFGLRPKGTQVYTTDARAGLNGRVGPEPTMLPVALQVPGERASADRAVTPTRAEASRPNTPSPRVMDIGLPRSPNNEPTTPTAVPDFGGKPSKPGEDEVNPLPPAAEAGPSAAVANRMPDLPAVDPLKRAGHDEPRPNTPGEGPKIDPAAVPDPDEKAAPAVTPADAAGSASGLPEPTFPPSYTAQAPPAAPRSLTETSKTQPPGAVVASPQVVPTSQAMPSPQSGVCSECGCHVRKKPCCLRRLVQRVWKLGQGAQSPAVPH